MSVPEAASVTTKSGPFAFLSDLVIAADVMPDQWAFYIQGLAIPISCCITWSDSICKFYGTPGCYTHVA